MIGCEERIEKKLYVYIYQGMYVNIKKIIELAALLGASLNTVLYCTVLYVLVLLMRHRWFPTTVNPRF